MKKFSNEEMKILSYMTRGYNNTEIGKLLYKSKHTVKAHVSSVLRKSGAKNRTEAVFLVCQDKKILNWLINNFHV